MSHTLIFYHSKYGSTARYAQLLGEALAGEAHPMRELAHLPLERFDWVLFACPVYASGIAGLSVLRRHFARLRGKRMALFCVGASPYDEAALEALRTRNLTGALAGIPLFSGRGGWDESRMTLRDRTLCRLLQRMLARQDPDSYEPWMRALMEAAGRACDWVSPEYLHPLLRLVRQDAAGAPATGGR